MTSTDARPVPRKNTAYRVTFPLRDVAGALVPAAADLDSEFSIDAGTFADCASEAVEIATASGVYYLDLSADEMNGDLVAIKVTSSTPGTASAVIVLYPEEAGDYRVNVAQWNGTTVATPAGAGIPDVNVKNAGNVAWASGSITSSVIANDALTATAVAASVGSEIATAVWAAGTRLLTAGTNIVLVKGAGVTGFNDLSAGDMRTAVGLGSANLDTQLSAASTKLDTIDNFIDTEVAAIKSKTDSLTFTIAGTVNANVTYINETEVGGDGEVGTAWGPA